MYYLGIDPGGSSGAFAAINEDGQPIFSSEFSNWKDIYSASIFELGNSKVKVALEKVHAMPMQGVSSMFSFGANYGGWLSLLEGHCISHILVPPQTWMKAILGAFPKGESKARALEFAQRRWPNDNLRKKDSGVVDALCLALYARKDHLGIL